MSIDDLNKILEGDTPSKEIRDRDEEIFEFIPELKKCKGFKQNSDWHLYDVYEHILHVVDYVDNDLILRMSALFHDIGKPETYTEDEFGKGHFYGHWDKSAEIFQKFAINNRMNKENRELITKLITYHDLNFGKFDDTRVEEIKTEFSLKEIILLYKLKKADLLAQNPKYHFLLEEYQKQEEVYKLLYKKEEE